MQQKLEEQQQTQRLEQLAPATLYGHPVIRASFEIEFETDYPDQQIVRAQE